VRNGPEVVGEVRTYDFRMTSEQRCFHLDPRLLGIAARPVGVLLWWKVGFGGMARRRVPKMSYAAEQQQGLQ
jgi:hypothetical protein